MKCQFATKDSVICRANAMRQSEYCFSHNPDTRHEHKDATRKGGSVGYENSLVQLEPIDLTDSRMILYLLADTINRTRTVRVDGSMDVRVANSIGFLASKMLEAQSQIIIEERVLALEEQFRK